MGRAIIFIAGLALGVLLNRMIDVQDVTQQLNEVQLGEERTLVRREVGPSHAREKIKLKKHVRRINQHAKKLAGDKKVMKEKKNPEKKQKKSQMKLKKTVIKQSDPTCSSNSSKKLSWMAMKTASQILTQVVCRQQIIMLHITN